MSAPASAGPATPVAELFVVPAPARGGHAPVRFTPLHESSAAWDHIAFVLNGAVDDDDAADTVAALIAYAWRQHGGGKPLPDTNEGEATFCWPRPNVIVAALPMWARTGKSRTRDQATLDLISAVQRYCREGSPWRVRTDDRLIGPADVAVCWALTADSRAGS